MHAGAPSHQHRRPTQRPTSRQELQVAVVAPQHRRIHQVAGDVRPTRAAIVGCVHLGHVGHIHRVAIAGVDEDVARRVPRIAGAPEGPGAAGAHQHAGRRAVVAHIEEVSVGRATIRRRRRPVTFAEPMHLLQRVEAIGGDEDGLRRRQRAAARIHRVQDDRLDEAELRRQVVRRHAVNGQFWPLPIDSLVVFIVENAAEIQ